MATATKKKATKKSTKATTETPIMLPKMKIEMMHVKLVGDSSLVCHGWSEKAIGMMLDKQMGKAKAAKEPKSPTQDYKDSLYQMPDGDGLGFPATAFKSAAVDACSHVDGVTKVLARGAFHVIGDMVKVNGKPNMREDMVRIAMGTADIRYRGEFKQWSVELLIRYSVNVLSAEQIINLFNVAGFAIGVGEHRPQKNGSWGMFHVAKRGDK